MYTPDNICKDYCITIITFIKVIYTPDNIDKGLFYTPDSIDKVIVHTRKHW